VPSDLYDLPQGDSFYELKAADIGVSPVTIQELAAHLKIDESDLDAAAQIMISAATSFAEKYIGRDIRVNTWTLLIDVSADPISITRAYVDEIVSINYLVSDVLTLVASSVYYLKRAIRDSQVLVSEDQKWPADIDNREQAVEVRFRSKLPADMDLIKIGILQHSAYMHANRGDCNCASSSDVYSAAKESGALGAYQMVKIARA